MPNRIIREGILTSERVDALTSWAAEVFYRRLMNVVDDYGRYYANASLLRAACYPLKLDKVSNADIEKWLADSAGAALVSTYEYEGKRYLQLLDFRQQERAKHSKFPSSDSACVADAQQPIAPAHLVVDVVESVDGGEKARARKKAKTPIPPDFGLTEAVIEWAKRKGYGDLQAHLDAFRLKAAANDYRYADWSAALMSAIEADWAGVRSGRRPAAATTAKPWKAGGEPDEVLMDAARKLQLEPWDRSNGETHGQFRSRIVAATGGPEILQSARSGR